jgi:hypothetical protein
MLRAFDSVCTPATCRDPRTSFSPAGGLLSSSTDASGISNQGAATPASRQPARNSGRRSSMPTGSGIRQPSGTWPRWVGAPKSYGSARLQTSSSWIPWHGGSWLSLRVEMPRTWRPVDVAADRSLWLPGSAARPVQACLGSLFRRAASCCRRITSPRGCLRPRSSRWLREPPHGTPASSPTRKPSARWQCDAVPR